VPPNEPIGTIYIWSGSVASIPAKFRLCNGQSGTPDLRNNFVLAAGGTYNPADTGGQILHTHTGSAAHTHTDIPAIGQIAGGANYLPTTSQANATFTTDNGNVIPPYYAKAFIMRYK